MKSNVLVPLFLIFMCSRVILTESKLQQQATIDANDDDDDDDRDEDDDDDVGYSKSEIDDDGKIYKNPRNSPSIMCPRDSKQAELFGQQCLRKCSTDEDCKSKKKKCRCDGACGMSCIKPERECPDLKEIIDGKMTVTGKLFGDTAHYMCEPDYFLVGLSERTCRADGRWSGSEPACKRGPNSFCTDPPKIANARHNALVEQTSFNIDATVQYFCDEGYETEGFQNSKCLVMDGKVSWFGPDITCNPRSCGTPTEIPNGWHAGECHKYGCRISYHCADGHELVGKAEKVCLVDGTWSPRELPQCVQVTSVQCPLPDNPRNGKAIYTSYAYNAIVTYECKYSYVLKGQATRKCQADRKWSGQAPECNAIDCGSPGILYNGWIEGLETEGTGLGASLIFRCKEHMKLIGNTSSVCEENGRWRYPLPHCLAPCIIPQIEKGNVTVAARERDHINNITVVDHGERLNVNCIKNYEFAANSTPVFCNNGTWTIIPTCSPARCKQMPKSPRNGMVIAPKMNHGMRAVFKCKDGFSLIGGGPNNSSYHVQCHYGTWRGDIPRCTEVYCAFPGYVENGKVLLVGNMGVYDYRSYVTKVPNNKQIMYDCDKGYVLSEGPPGATCIGGNWSPRQLPVCLPGQHPRLRWSRRRRSTDNSNSTTQTEDNLKKFVEFFRTVGKKMLRMELNKVHGMERQNSKLLGIKGSVRDNVTDISILMDNVSGDNNNNNNNNETENLKIGRKFKLPNYNCTLGNILINKRCHAHRNKSRSKDEKIIDVLKIVYRRLKRIDGKRKNNGTNTTMHDLLNMMAKNFFHVDLSETRRNNSVRNHDGSEIRNQLEFTKLRREFEKMMKFYNKSLRWSGKQNRRESKRRKTEAHGDVKKNHKAKKQMKVKESKNYYQGFYEFINGYVNEKLSLLEIQNGTEELIKKMNIDKFTVKNGTTFTIGEMYAVLKHIIDDKLDSNKSIIITTPETKVDELKKKIQNDVKKINSSTDFNDLRNEIPMSINKTEVAKLRTKRIRNAADQSRFQNRKLLSVNSPLSNVQEKKDKENVLGISKSKQYTLNGLDAQQQSRSKRFLTSTELDNQIFLKNLYLNAYEDEYRSNVRRSIIDANVGQVNWTVPRRRKGNLDYFKTK